MHSDGLMQDASPVCHKCAVRHVCTSQGGGEANAGRYVSLPMLLWARKLHRPIMASVGVGGSKKEAGVQVSGVVVERTFWGRWTRGGQVGLGPSGMVDLNPGQWSQSMQCSFCVYLVLCCLWR